MILGAFEIRVSPRPLTLPASLWRAIPWAATEHGAWNRTSGASVTHGIAALQKYEERQVASETRAYEMCAYVYMLCCVAFITLRYVT